MGTFLTYRIAGGEGDMRHFFAQFGPALEWPWTKLTDVPELTDEFLDAVVAQSDEQAGGLSVGELERRRDDNLVAILHALREQRYAAGELLRETEARLFDALAGADGKAADESQPLRLYETTVRTDWVDYNGHMTESRYLEVLGNATDALLRHVGLDDAYLRDGHSAFTVETHIRHLAEARAGDELSVDTQLLDGAGKRLHVFHIVSNPRTGTVLATGEHLLLHVDTTAKRAATMEEPLLSRVTALAAAHSSLPAPEGAGRFVGQARG
jgi:carnitine 3-dehydrogenase